MSRRSDEANAREAERKRLVARREKLFADLVRLEREHHAGKVAEARYASRRDALMIALEQIYGALDDDLGPEPANRAA